MADFIHGVTQLANWVTTTFAPAAFGYFQHERTLSNHAIDMSYMLNGARSVKLPQSDPIVAESRGAGGETAVEYTGKGSAESVATLTVDQLYTAALLITDVARLQTTTALQNHYIQASSYALLSSFESYLAGLLQAATTNDVSIATTDNNLTWDYFISAISKLQVYNAYKPGMMALACSPEAWALGVKDWGAKYTSIETTNENFGLNGALGKLAGTPVYVSDDWDGDGTTSDETATLWNKNSLVYGLQNAFGIIGPVPDPKNGGTGFSVELYYGGTLILEKGVANFNNP